MQAKGFIKFVSVLLLIASIWSLSFTFVVQNIERKAKLHATNSDGTIDSEKESEYLRERRTKNLWMGFTYKECKEKELGLGLDLKGGMNVMMEISLPDIILSLSSNSTDSTFRKALQKAEVNKKNSTKDFVTLFSEAWNSIEPNGRMSRVFATIELRDKIKHESTNEEVIAVLNAEADAAVSNSYNVLRSRIDRFGVSSPNIQKIGNTGRILVELPGVKEPERVRKLLQGTANLEFWETYENSEIINSLNKADQVIRDYEKIYSSSLSDSTKKADVPTLVKDSTFASNDSILKDSSKLAFESNDSILAAVESPLFAVFHRNLTKDNQLAPGPVIGFADSKDTAKINNWLRLTSVKSLFPSTFRPMWTIKATGKEEVIFALVAIKSSQRGNVAPLDGSVIIDARKTSDPTAGFGASMDMNSEGSKKWAGLTRNNVGRAIAIVLDGYVYSYPAVYGEISGGKSSISGDFNSNDADDLVNVLKSGKMPAPTKIAQEAVVGPSLGQESINSGLMSFLIAFCLVLGYMWFYYGQAGTTANVALLSNVLLLFGVMASSGYVLTLPGIAGIVLTLGMAVDANVIIYERIKEELKAGKAIRQAVKDGYGNAMSAIVDGQLTTLITGVILALLGTGPVKGFAITLVIGIVTSLVTSIFISRLVFEWMMTRNKKISFGNKFTLNFLSNTKIDFLGMRKKAYVVSIVMSIVGVGFLMTKGMSYGVDFTGGRNYVIKFDQNIETNGVRSAIAQFDPSAEVKQFGSSNQLKVTTKYKVEENSDEVDTEVLQNIYDKVKPFFKKDISYEEFSSTDTNPFGVISSETVGPSIANDMKTNAYIAVFLALIAIFFYIAIRFSRWEFGFGGVVSLFHDALFTISIFSIGSGILPWAMDVDQSFIAAILTIIGYSINDTVVIFDRIRENKILHPTRSWGEQINDAVNSTIMRTINTSMTVLIVLLSIFIFGGEVIRGFSFALIVGVLVGVYSTVFIAIPLAYEFLSRKEAKEQDELRKATATSSKPKRS